MDTKPTIKADYRNRIIAFDNEPEAIEERDVWRHAGLRARINLRNGVYNVVVGPMVNGEAFSPGCEYESAAYEQSARR